MDNISFDVEEGECFGLLGPNGAGKTTTLKILATVLNPDSGSAKICGYSILENKDEVRANLGMVFEELSLDIQLTGRDNLDFHACMYHMPREERKKRIAEVLKMVALEDKADIPVKDYSGGMQRRLEIVRSMLTNPRLLLLDEPTVGLDVQTRRFMWDHVREMNHKQGVTVLLATHYIEEADYLCDRIAIMNQGRIVAIGTPSELKKTFDTSRYIEVSFEQSIDPGIFSAPGITRAESWGDKWRVYSDNPDVAVKHIASVADREHLTIVSLATSNPTLEEAFVRLTAEA